MFCNEEKVEIEGQNQQQHIEETHTTWQSCCLTLDREFTLFITKYLLMVGLIIFFGYNLSQVTECNDKNLWQSLLLLVIGIALPSPSLTNKK